MHADFSLLVIRAMHAPVPTISCITDGIQRRAEAPKATGRAYQLTSEASRATPDIVTGMFLVNSMSEIFLIESGSIHSFVSLSFSRNFDISLGTLDCALEITIANDCIVSTSSIY